MVVGVIVCVAVGVVVYVVVGVVGGVIGGVTALCSKHKLRKLHLSRLCRCLVVVWLELRKAVGYRNIYCSLMYIATETTPTTSSSIIVAVARCLALSIIL